MGLPTNHECIAPFVTLKPPKDVTNNKLLADEMNVIACCRVSVRETDIFRLWLRYYRPHVKMIAVVIVLENNDSAEELETLCNEHGATYRIEPTNWYKPGESLAQLTELVLDLDGNFSWILHADSDEFLGEIGNLSLIIEALESEGADYAMAWMADRLGFGGRLADLSEVGSFEELDATFPVRTAITERLALGCATKVCLSRWPYMGDSHHPKPPLHVKSKQRLTFEHFKWRTGLHERLAKRIRDHKASMLPWGCESQRLLEELDTYGRFRAERFLAPRSKRIHGWMDYEDIYLDVVNRTPEGGHLVEIGVWQGRSICFLAEAALAAGKRLRIDAIDPFKGFPVSKTGYPDSLRELVTKHSWIDVVSSNLRRAGVLDQINLIQARSPDAAGMYKELSLDFVWLDRGNDYASIVSDIEAWWQYIKPGGLLGGHNYERGHVKKAVKERLPRGSHLDERGNSFLIAKMC
ncbi:MAG: hypothetical protein JWM68_509 [Verrucomicrobiales bacterium]|nr:hypothetical protein [Verrucomicrobiales bacterium]